MSDSVTTDFMDDPGIPSVSCEAGAGIDLKRSRRPKGDRRAASATPTLDRLPPHALEAEQGVLGCALLEPNQCIGECIEKLKDDGKSAFYDLRHQTIYETLAEMFNSRTAIDLITVQQNLKDRQLLEQVGGIAYLSQLQDAVPSTANLSYYLEIVREKYLLRKLIATCSGVVGKVYDYEGEVEALLEEAERDVLSIRCNADSGRGDTDISLIINKMADNFEDAANGKKPEGLESGFIDLDRIAGFMRRQELIIVAGTPSSGKTTLLYNIFYKLASSGVMTGLINLDTSAYSAIYRYSCLAGQVDGWKCERGIASEGDLMKMVVGTGKINSLKSFIKIRDDVNNEHRLTSACRLFKQQGCKVIGIDFMQQLSCAGKSKYEKISRAAEVIKGLSKELDIPIIAISSLNRENAKEQKKPSMQDLNGSGDIEYHANKIILLHCEDRESSARSVELNVAKNKDGMTGRFNLTMFAPQFRFENASKISDADVPYSD